MLVQEKWTALMAASNNGCYEAVDALLDHGADPNMQDFVSDCGFRWHTNVGHTLIFLYRLDGLLSWLRCTTIMMTLL